VIIEPAKQAEADVLTEIQRAAAVAAFAHIFPQEKYPFPAEAIRRGWNDALNDPNVETYLAWTDPGAVGLVSIGYGFLRTLFVEPGSWGTGVGSALHNHGLDRLKELGFSEARLWTLTDNAQAQRFYEHRGWTATGATRVVPFPPNPLDIEYRRPLDTPS
jgi:GNAT superfamily N-acetyltransferase